MDGRLKNWARAIKRDVLAVYLAGRDPRMPWSVKALAIIVAAYALSPVDLIPGFIPVLGYLDDVILVPLGILLVVRLLPDGVVAEHRATTAALQDRPVSLAAAIVIVFIWLASVALTGVAWLSDL